VRTLQDQRVTRPRRHISAAMQDEIDGLGDSGKSPIQIEEDLMQFVMDGKIEGPVPNLRTIRRVVADRRLPDESGAWEIDAATEIDPNATFGVLAEVVTHTGGRVSQFSRLEARWVTTLTALRGDLPAWEVYRLAREYIVRREGSQTTADLDAFLLFAPWLESQVEAYLDAILDGVVPAPPVFLQDLIANNVRSIKVLAAAGPPGRRMNLRKLIESMPEDMPLKQYLAQREGAQDDSQR